jgi:hypothetical protein
VEQRGEDFILQARDIVMAETFTNVLVMETPEEGNFIVNFLFASLCKHFLYEDLSKVFVDVPNPTRTTTLSSTPASASNGVAGGAFDREVFGEWFEELQTSPFLFPTCRITSKAQKLHQLAKQALQEAGKIGREEKYR